MLVELTLKILKKTKKNPLQSTEYIVKAKVYVTYRDGVLDPQGQTIHEVLKQHGHAAVRNVRVGKMIEVEIDDMPTNSAEQMLEEISDKMLANPVIETYRVVFE